MEVLHGDQQTVMEIHQAVEHITSAMGIGEGVGDGKLGSFDRKIENFVQNHLW